MMSKEDGLELLLSRASLPFLRDRYANAVATDWKVLDFGLNCYLWWLPKAEAIDLLALHIKRKETQEAMVANL